MPDLRKLRPMFPALTLPRRLPHWELVTLVASLMALNAAAIDILIPALSSIGLALAVEDENSRQFVITAYVLGFGAAQIVYGTLSDRFGRRPILLAGLAIYTLASIAAVFAPTFAALLVLRAVQGVGAAATRVVAVSIVRDQFDGRRMASVMSIVMMIFMVIPVLAPNVGQLVMLVGSWPEIFMLVAGFGLAVSLWTLLRLPETLNPQDRVPLTVERVAGAFRTVLTNRLAFGYAIGTALIFGVLFGFINQAEQLYTVVYGIGPEFTLYFSAVAILMAGVSFVNSRLVERYGMRRLAHSALLAFAGLAALHLVLTILSGGVLPFWLFLPLLAMTFCMFGLIGTNFNALAMDPLGHVAGTASSVLGFTQTLGGGLLGAAVGYMFDGTAMPLLVGFVVLSLASLGAILWAEEGRLFRSRYDAPKIASPAMAE